MACQYTTHSRSFMLLSLSTRGRRICLAHCSMKLLQLLFLFVGEFAFDIRLQITPNFGLLTAGVNSKLLLNSFAIRCPFCKKSGDKFRLRVPVPPKFGSVKFCSTYIRAIGYVCVVR